MRLWDELVSELATLSIRVDSVESVTIANVHGQKTLPIEEALTHISQNFKKNADFLVSLWKKAASLKDLKNNQPSNQITQRLFADAVKHLAKQSSCSTVLKRYGLSQAFNHVLECDAAEYSEEVMNKMIEFRLSIDWLTHIVNYDAYRISLLGILKSGADKLISPQPKLSFMMDNFDIPLEGERATPWAYLKDTIQDHLTSSRPNYLRGPNEQESVEQNRSGRSLMPDGDPREDKYFANSPTKWEDIFEESSIPMNSRYKQ